MTTDEKPIEEPSKQTRELIREILDLPDRERIEVLAALRDDLDAQGNLLEAHQADEQNQKMRDALEAFAAVRKHLDLSDDEARLLTMAKYDNAQKELKLGFSAQKVVSAFDNSWDLVKKTSLGGRLPVSQSQKWKRKAISQKSRLHYRHLVGIKKWLDTSPESKTRNAYNVWREKYNEENKGLEPLLVTDRTILAATTKSWQEVLSEAENASDTQDAQVNEVADASDRVKAKAVPILMTVDETADLLNIERTKVLEWIMDNRIPFVELPSDDDPVYRIPTAALVARLGGKYKLFTEIGRVRPEKLLYSEGLLAQRLKDAREAFGWNYSELAKAAGVAQPLVGKIERGDIRQVSIGSIARLARAFGVSTDYFLSPYEKLPGQETTGIRARGITKKRG